MTKSIESLVQGWGDNESAALRLRITNLEKWLYHTYEPDKFGDGDFEQRLERWINNVASDEERRTLFKLIAEIFYVGPVEFEELYRCAYQGAIARWLIDLEAIDISSVDSQSRLVEAASKTWFCPVSDSFRINAFFHINNLAAGASLRPDWRSLFELGDPTKIANYVKGSGITRLVLLEDFVGGGSQAIDAVEFATTIPGLQVLFVPLIICPDGVSRMRTTEAKICHGRPSAFRYEAVMELPSTAFLTPNQSPFINDVAFTDAVRKLLNDTYPQVGGGVPSGSFKPYHPYGYPHHKPTGGMVVMYSNTPDNTLPIIHWRPKSKTWSPLFPRHSRD
jgi:hypothetical protein